MSDEVNVHKISDKQQRQAEHLKDRLQDQGMGRDHAEQEALKTVAQQENTGGGNSAGDAKKGANQQGDHRRGSDKDAG